MTNSALRSPLSARSLVAVALLVIGMRATPAQACADGYNDDECHDVCLPVGGGTTIECDGLRNGGTGNAVMTAVAAHDAEDDFCEGYDYCAWGGDAAGNEFCCSFVAESESTFILIGTDNADVLSLYFTCDEEYDMDNRGSATVLDGKIAGRGGGDFLYGSRVNALDYHDQLHGEDGNDTIVGQAGDDELFGDANDDAIFGGGGHDTIWGGGGVDTLRGEGEGDTIYGGSDQDLISGGDGDDVIHGDSGPDTICGDDGNDTLTGDNEEDILWGGAGSGDTATGGNAYDQCSADTYTCEALWTSGRPMACPDP